MWFKETIIGNELTIRILIKSDYGKRVYINDLRM